MRKIFPFIALLTICNSCNFIWDKTVEGNGKMVTEQRSVSIKPVIEVEGNFEVEISMSESPAIKIEADENLLPYIITENRDGALLIRSKDNARLSSSNKIKVYITTEKIEDISLAGSGNIKGEGKFTGSEHLKLSIAGSGNILLDINSPKVTASIAGSGNIILSGETKDSKIEIAGSGDYKAENLKAENVNIDIAGSGNAHVFAGVSLDVDIAGSGDVFYKGSPSIQQDVVGSGKLKPIQ